MKLTKKLEAEILKIYHAYWDAYLSGDMKTFASMLDDNIKVFGSAVSEVFNNKAEAVRFYKATADQLTGKAQFRNRKISVHPVDQTVLIHEQSDLFVLIDNEWTFYGPARISAMFVNTPDGWKLAHQHGSFPDSRAEEGEQIAADKIKKENLELREAVKRRTVELEQKNRELEIEAALERVRTVAMGMNRPDDILDVCKVMFKELKSLGFEDLRNALINFWDDTSGSLLDYDYSDYADGHIAKLPYNRHPTFEEFQKKIRGATDAFAELVVPKGQLKTWQQVRRASGEYEDARLEGISALYYYFYSIGVGAIGISTFSPLSSEKLDVLKRFRNVFDLAHRRYADIQQAEAQAREAKIEAALERTRTRSMLMQHSNELDGISRIFHEQLLLLGIDSEFSFVWLPDEDKQEHMFWATWVSELDGVPLYHGRAIKYPLDKTEPGTAACYVAWESGQPVHETFVPSAQIATFFAAWEELLRGAERFKPELFPEGIYYTEAYMKYGCFGIDIRRKLTDDEKEIIRRFAVEFERAYTRFLDLQRAEAQAREAQIETALERVRSRTMGMQKSDELKEVIQIVYEQFVHLNIHIEHTGFILDYKARNDYNSWIADHLGSPANIAIPYFDAVYYNLFNEAKKNGLDFFTVNLSLEEKNKFYRDLFKHLPGFPEESKEFIFSKPALTISTALLDDVALYIENFTGIPYTDEENAILKRFGKVFQQTYTRFLDLTKAEAQAREAQIEAALEKVRSRSLAMHTSNELQDVVSVVSERLRELNIDFYTAIIIIFIEGSRDCIWWLVNKMQQQYPKVRIPYADLPYLRDLLDAREHGRNSLTASFTGKEKREFYNYLLEHTDFKNIPQEQKDFLLGSEYVTMSSAFSKNTGIHLTRYSDVLFTEAENEIVRRFAGVFDQAYVRFLDLQKSEAQAREAQIEAVLERIRASAMAMHTSDELENVVHILREQMGLLGQPELETSVISILEDDSDHLFSWYAFRPPELSSGQIMTGAMSFPWKASALTREMIEAYRSGQKELTMKADAARAVELERVLAQADPRIVLHAEENVPVWYHLTFFSGGTLLMVSHQPPSEEAQSLQRRAAAVFDLAYRRYHDLKKAEAQAREAQIELSLERIRANVTAMKESSELLDIVVTMRNEFVALGHEAHYFWHMRWLPEKYEKAMTSGDGTRIGMVMTLPRHIHGDIKLVDSWEKSDEPTLIFPMDVDTAVEYVHKMITLGDFQQVDPQAPTLDDIRHIGGLTFIMARTTHGEIGYSLPGPIPHPSAEAVATLARFAGVFDLAYRRFEDLKIAEAQARQAQLDLIQLQQAKKKAEDALSELRATQEQLLQQEKLASLGQLTAGIAHEIKNPLNFVNNFSSVSVELVDEAMEEIKKLSGNGGDAQQLLDDVKKNLNKIIEHGTRADGIVKSMLQHSRGGSGKKEPVDLNALVKEYVNLAFHGMRAGKNPINVDIALDLQDSIGRVPIIAEDFSRVIINLCQNAFDAMREKVNTGGKSYLPKLTVRTLREADKIIVEVGDNGPGIPDAIKDKILQPFFTTKKGTQGTGLGLSITHDIVKAHGGIMTIESSEPTGSIFRIAIPLSGS